MCDEYHTNERVRKLREHLLLTRDELALKARIKTSQLANIERRNQRTPAFIIERIAQCWPNYGYWLATGRTLPEAGQISPDIEEERKKLGRTRTAGQ